MDNSSTRSNNPYDSGWSRYYERVLALPLIRQIRGSEERVLEELTALALRPEDRVLEIGPGTGRATVRLARCAARLTVVEQAPAMVTLLRQRLRREGLSNVTVVEGDFAAHSFPEPFDVVVLIGVLDYALEPAVFLRQAAAAARRELLFTVPHCGALAHAFRLGNRLRGVRIATFTPEQVVACLPGFQVRVVETGLRTRWCRGLTLACRAVRG